MSPFLDRPLRSIEEARSEIKRDTDALDAWREKVSIRQRREQLASDLRKEGRADAANLVLLSDAAIQSMIDYEAKIIASVANAFSGSAP